MNISIENECNDLTTYAKKIMALADDLAASATSMKGQGYSTFIQTREELTKLIEKEEKLCRACAGKLCRFSTKEQIIETFSAFTATK
jgi:hypothetical protein